MSEEGRDDEPLVDARRERLSEDRKRLLDMIFKNRKNGDAAGEPDDAAGSEGADPAGSRASPRLVRMKAGGTKPPFFCVHAILGSVFPYQKLALHMPDDRPFYGIEARGMDGQEPPLDDVYAMAASYLAAIEQVWPSGPYHIGGYSFGASVAYEIARLAREQGKAVGLVALIGMGAPPQAAVPGWEENMRFTMQYFDDLQRLVKNTMLAEMGPAGAQIPDPIAAFEAQLTPMQRVMLANGRAQLKYAPRPYPGDLDVIVTREQAPPGPPDATMGFGTLVGGTVHTQTLSGNHLSMFDEPHVVELADLLARRLADQEGGAPS